MSLDVSSDTSLIKTASIMLCIFMFYQSINLLLKPNTKTQEEVLTQLSSCPPSSAQDQEITHPVVPQKNILSNPKVYSK